MKVAFATKDRITINDHFGWAKMFAIYDVTSSGYQLDHVAEVPEDYEEEEDKIHSKIRSLNGVSILYCEAIGPGAAARVIKAKIHPIKVKEPKSIEEEAQALVNLLNSNPPPWIRRIIAKEELL